MTHRGSAQGSRPEVDDGALAPVLTTSTAPTELAALFLRFHAELVRLALLMVGDQPTAEDVVQDVFTRLHARTQTSAGVETLPYVRAAVLNGCRSQLRRRAVAQRFARSNGSHVRQLAHESAEQEMIRSEERARVMAALAALPFRRREVLVLRYYLGLSEAEIAQMLRISPGTVKSTAARGLAALASRLGEGK